MVLVQKRSHSRSPAGGGPLRRGLLGVPQRLLQGESHPLSASTLPANVNFKERSDGEKLS